MITSFSNPNYVLNSADALNSNLPFTQSQYYDDNGHVYEGICSADSNASDDTNSPDDTTTTDVGTRKGRNKYAQMDLSAMGIDLPQVHQDLDTYGSMCSASTPGTDSEQQNSGDSAVQSPEYLSSKSDGIMLVGHRDHEADTDAGSEGGETPYGDKSNSFLGYYASLELSAKSRAEDNDRLDDEDGEEEDASDGGKRETQTSADSKQNLNKDTRR